MTPSENASSMARMTTIRRSSILHRAARHYGSHPYGGSLRPKKIGPSASLRVARLVSMPRTRRSVLDGLLEHFLNLGFELRVRHGAYHAHTLQLAVLDASDHERGRSVDPGRRSFRDVLVDRRAKLVRIDARLELGHVHRYRLRVSAELVGLELARVDDHRVPQFPELALLRRTACRSGAAPRVFVERQRKVAADVADLAGVDEVGLDLRERIVVVALAERALVVGVLDHDQRRVFLADREAAGRESHDYLVVDRCRGGGCRVSSRARSDRLVECSQLVEDLLRLLRRNAVGVHESTAAE